MCGICGFTDYNEQLDITEKSNIVNIMIEKLNHRGPDESGKYLNPNVTLGHSRLSIIDFESGTQPIFNEDKSIVVIFNGEIFNYIELRKDLISKGHKFYTKSDTEVIVHLYEEYGTDFALKLNGQFAISIYDIKKDKIILIRDHVGICPLYYSIKNNDLVFASEFKSFFVHPSISKDIDYKGLDQIYTIWVNIPPTTIYKDIKELAPGQILIFEKGNHQLKSYWEPTFPNANDYNNISVKEHTEKIREIIESSVSLRLRADVPVAAYLSGGLDSSIITSVAQDLHNMNIKTFSINFKDSSFDEAIYQKELVDKLKTSHHSKTVDSHQIGKAFFKSLEFIEKPILRTAPAPLMLLSEYVNQNNTKVVLTGEGADEIFGGYNILKESKVRRFWSKFPDSTIRPNLLKKLYPYVNNKSWGFWKAFFKKDLEKTDDIFYSHRLRWNNTSYIKNFLSDKVLQNMNTEENVYEELRKYLNPNMKNWHPFAQAQYLEMRLFMPGYLLTSQGDRVLMANSVEGRFPFLDRRVIDYASTIHPNLKCKILNEKFILKESFKECIPKSITNRAKQPYRAPVSKCFAKVKTDVDKLFKNNDSNIINNDKFKMLLDKLQINEGQNLSERENMALAGILSLKSIIKNINNE
jgi:asparagine synthase (glutamine-hydrolysing)